MPPRKVTHGFFFVSVRSAGAVEERSLALASCIVGWRTFLGDVASERECRSCCCVMMIQKFNKGGRKLRNDSAQVVKRVRVHKTI